MPIYFDTLEDEMKNLVKVQQIFFIKVTSFISDFCLSMAISTLFWAFPGTHALFNFLLNQLIVKVNPGLEAIGVGAMGAGYAFTFVSLSMVFAIFTGIRILSCFLIGRSPASYLLGVKLPEGEFFGLRLRAMLREVLAPLSLLLIIPELPVIWGKRTFKEVVTGMPVLVRGGLWPYVSFILVFPFFSIYFICYTTVLSRELP